MWLNFGYLVDGKVPFLRRKRVDIGGDQPYLWTALLYVIYRTFSKVCQNLMDY